MATDENQDRPPDETDRPGRSVRDDSDGPAGRAPTDTDPPGGVDMPSDAGPNPPTMPGTSEEARPVQGIYRPDVRPGGEDIDIGDRSLAGRGRNARGPQRDADPDVDQ